MKLNEYPAYRYLFFLVLGILLANYFTFSFLEIGLAILIFFGILLFLLNSKLFAKSRIIFPSIFFFLGLLSSKNHEIDKQHISNFNNCEGYLVNINSATESKQKSYKVTAEVFAVKIANKWHKANGNTLLYFLKSASDYPNFGEIFLIKGTPKIIESPKNQFEFDYKTFQARKNILTQQFLRENQFVRLGINNLHPVFGIANDLSNYTHSVFKTYIDTPEALSVAEALVAGIKSQIDQETLQSYSDTGAIHILSVSGGHVALLFLGLNWIFSKFLSTKKIGFHIIIIGLLWFYALVTGLSPPVCRATLMFMLFQIGVYLNRERNSLNILGFSAVILLLINPNWLFDVGFQLSNLAVFGILLLYPRLSKLVEIQNFALRWLWEISVLSFTAQIFTFPLSVYYFHQFPNLFLLSNPVVSLLAMLILPAGLLLLIFSKVPFLGDTLGWVLNWSIKALNFSILKLQSLPYAVTKGVEINTFTLITLYAITILIILFFNFKQLKYLKLATILVVILAGFKIHKTFNQNFQHQIAFLYIPNETGISIINGRNAEFISQDSSISDPLIYQYHLKNYYDHLGINNAHSVALQNQSAIFLNNKFFKIQWFRYPSDLNFDLSSNYILCSNNAISTLNALDDYKGQIILDGSNKKWVVENLKEEAQEKNINLISLYDSGSKFIKLHP